MRFHNLVYISEKWFSTKSDYIKKKLAAILDPPLYRNILVRRKISLPLQLIRTNFELKIFKNIEAF